MLSLHHNDDELLALADHQLDDEAMRVALERLATDNDAASRYADYTAQAEALAALRDELCLAPPPPALSALADELEATVQRQDQVRMAMAVGGAMALMSAIGYATWSSTSQDGTQQQSH